MQTSDGFGWGENLTCLIRAVINRVACGKRATIIGGLRRHVRFYAIHHPFIHFRAASISCNSWRI